MPSKKKPVVNIDARVSRKIRVEKVPKVKGKPPSGYSSREVKAYIEKRHKGKVKVVSDKQYKKLTDEKKFQSFTYSEAERQYKEHRQNWYYRFKPVEDSEYKKKVTSVRIDRKTGEEKTITRTRTFRRFRDTETGRFISYDKDKKKLIRDKLTGRYKSVFMPSVRTQRKEMRKELAIHQMAERKRISVKDARKLYAEFEDTGMDRYILKEYSKTPE